MSNPYKKITISAFVGIIFLAYFPHIIYAFYISGIYPVKAQVKKVSVSFNGTWLPAISNESSIWLILKKENSLPTTIFFKIQGMKPLTEGSMSISWIGDKYEGFSKSNIYSQTINFGWGTANILKKEFTSDPNAVIVVVPEFKILINADNLDQLNEIKKFTEMTSQRD